MAFSNALTDTKIKKATPGDKASTLTDGRGLYLLVQPTDKGGGKLWRFKYNFRGRERLMALGSYPAVTLLAAREKHLAARQLLASGVDPMAERMAAKLAEKAATEGVFANVYTRWLAHWRQDKSPRHAEYVERRFADDVLPILGSRPIAEISAKDIRELAQKIDGRGARDIAKRAIQTIGQILDYAIQYDYTEHNPARTIKPGTILRHVETRNFPRVELPELPDLLRAIDTYKVLITRLAMKLLVLTFVRPSELREAKWSEFDFDGARWVVPKERMKHIYGRPRTPHIVPLSRQSIEILRAVQQLAGEGEYVFACKRKPSQPMSVNTIKQALDALGYKGKQSAHGFKGIASTVLYEHQFPKTHVEPQLAHLKRDKVAAAYDYAEHLGPRARMMQWYADYLDRVQHGAKVIPISA